MQLYTFNLAFVKYIFLFNTFVNSSLELGILLYTNFNNENYKLTNDNLPFITPILHRILENTGALRSFLAYIGYLLVM